MSDAEYDMLAPVDTDKWKVKCLLCNKNISKRVILDHVAREHQRLGDQCKQWHIVKDMNAHKKKKNLEHFSTQWIMKHNAVESRRARELETPVSQDVPEPLTEDPVPTHAPSGASSSGMTDSVAAC